MSNGAIHSKTANFGLNKINFDFPRWHTYEWTNWDLVDASLRQVGATPSSGAWQNSYVYVVGVRIVDTDSGAAYACLVGHTSSATGTFADDRAAHPTYWVAVTGVPHYREEWRVGETYYTGDIVVNQYQFSICLQTHIATEGSLFDNNLWSLIFDASATLAAIEVSDSPPPNPLEKSLWWDSDTGTLYLRYNDGNTSQWVDILAAGADKSHDFIPPPTDTKVYGSKGDDGWVRVTEEAPLNGNQYTRKDGGWNLLTTPFDALVPTGGNVYGYNGTAWFATLPLTGGTLTGSLTVNGNETINGVLIAKATTVDSIVSHTGGTFAGGLHLTAGDVYAGNGHITCTKTMGSTLQATFNAGKAADYGVTAYAGVGFGGIRGYSNNGAAFGILGHVNTYALYGAGQCYTTGFAQFNAGREANYGVYGYGGPGYGGVLGYSYSNNVYGILGYQDTYSFYGVGKLQNSGYAEFNTSRVLSAHGLYAYASNATAAIYGQSGNGAVHAFLANDNLYSFYGIGEILNSGHAHFTSSFRLDGQFVAINVRDVVSSGGRYVKINTSAGNVFSSTTYQDEHCFDVEDIEDTYADKVLELQPKFLRVDYEMDRPDWSKYGFLDNHTREVDVRFVAGDEIDGVYTPNDIDTQAIIACLLNVVKRMDARIKVLEAANGL